MRSVDAKRYLKPVRLDLSASSGKMLAEGTGYRFDNLNDYYDVKLKHARLNTRIL